MWVFVTIDESISAPAGFTIVRSKCRKPTFESKFSSNNPKIILTNKVDPVSGFDATNIWYVDVGVFANSVIGAWLLLSSEGAKSAPRIPVEVTPVAKLKSLFDIVTPVTAIKSSVFTMHVAEKLDVMLETGGADNAKPRHQAEAAPALYYYLCPRIQQEAVALLRNSVVVERGGGETRRLLNKSFNLDNYGTSTRISTFTLQLLAVHFPPAPT